MRQQGGNQFGLLNAAGFRLKHQAHGGFFAGLVTHYIKHRQQRLLEQHLVRAERLFSSLDLGICELLDFFQHPLRADARRQLLHHQLPLAARQLFNLPACAYLERAAPGVVGRGYIRRP